MERTPGRESKHPGLNIRPGRELYGQLTVIAAARGMSLGDYTRHVLSAVTGAEFDEHPEFQVAFDATEAARKAVTQKQLDCNDNAGA
jgi:hypothetical protein